jgi:UDP-N-acetylmuramoylalanine--D-glutamate ligase
VPAVFGQRMPPHYGRSAEVTDTLIVGLGTTGLSVARFLMGRGETFRVADSRLRPPGLAALHAMAPHAPVHTGAFDANLFASMRRLIVSPGVSLREPAVQAARRAGAEVLGDIEVFAREARAPVVAVTGSNGKSTVTTLLGEMARQVGLRVAVGGNLGTPALDLLNAPEPELYVLELSSFQLETVESLAPAAAVVLNLCADHLDRYDGIEDYAAAKARVFRGARVAVFNRDDPLVTAMTRDTRGVSFGLGPPGEAQYGLIDHDGAPWLARGVEPLLPERSLRMAGRHNTANALAALALADALGLARGPVLQVLQEFPGLAHRCQWVARVDGVDWYNDSKGTNLGATLAALSGMPTPVVLIAGGQGKAQDFAPLRGVAADKARAVVLLGQDAALISQALAGAVPVLQVVDMEAAVEQARRLAQPGDAVLLSPACASLDMFRNYEHRGEVYMACVRRLLP